MSRPLIGITMDAGPKVERYGLNCAYASGVERAGGLAVGLPYRSDLSLLPQIVDRLDGVIFIGGDDLDPSLYGQDRHPEAHQLEPERQKYELALLAEVEKRRKPALGICLGSQLLNVYRGGSLRQFLPDWQRANPLEHRSLDSPHRRHMVRLEPDTTLARWLNRREILTNTAHKQAVDRVGRGLRVIAHSEDGVIEGTEDPTFPLLMGIQWHPERLLDEPDHLAIFKLLISKCQTAS